MANKKTCQQCGKEATIHLTQIIDNQIKKMDFCEECAQAHGFGGSEALHWQHELSEGVNSATGASADEREDQAEKLAEPNSCEVCNLSGFTFEDFKETGRLGSPDCYALFRESLLPMLKNLHRATQHRGKQPAIAKDSPTTNPGNRIRLLQKKLEEAVRDERFEDAAALRDELSELSEESCLRNINK